MKKVLFICVLGLSVATQSNGQGCSVCTKTSADMDNKSARGLNGGILYLALLPLGIMGTLAGIWYRSNRQSI